MTTALSIVAGAIVATGAALAQPTLTPVSLDEGIAAYRSGDYASAWRALVPMADAGDVKAQRYLGYILVSGNSPLEADDEQRSGVEILTEAALAGDYASLIKLENMRRAGGEQAPSLSDIIAIEITRAEAGDPVTAWRLANRYETGDGVKASSEETQKWLTTVATTDAKVFPKSREAAFRLCELHATSTEANAPAKAKEWCARAAEDGHAGAAIMLRRIARLEL